MKRFVSFLLCFILIFSVSGCAPASTETNTVPDTTGQPAASPSAQATATPQPTATPEPTPTAFTFTFDRYLLPADLDAYLTENNAADDWELLADTIYDGGTSYTPQNAACTEALAAVFAASPYAALAELTIEEDQLAIGYTGAGTVTALEAAVTDLMETSLFNEFNTLETALALYRTASFGFTYEESEDNSLCRMLVEKKGGAEEFAAVLQYLFTQAGITAYLAEGSAAGITHWWVIAELDGSLYHFDPLFESSATGGLGLSYFGMSDEALEYAGCSTTYSTGCSSLAQKQSDLCPESFADGLFTDVTGWELDVLSHRLSLLYSGSEEFLTEVDTRNLTSN